MGSTWFELCTQPSPNSAPSNLLATWDPYLHWTLNNRSELLPLATSCLCSNMYFCFALEKNYWLFSFSKHLSQFFEQGTKNLEPLKDHRKRKPVRNRSTVEGLWPQTSHTLYRHLWTCVHTRWGCTWHRAHVGVRGQLSGFSCLLSLLCGFRQRTHIRNSGCWLPVYTTFAGSIFVFHLKLNNKQLLPMPNLCHSLYGDHPTILVQKVYDVENINKSEAYL